MISRGFEAVNTVFGGYFGFGNKKTRSLRERDVVKHGPYTAPHYITVPYTDRTQLIPRISVSAAAAGGGGGRRRRRPAAAAGGGGLIL
jgi:hypothetical protein